MVRPDDLRDLHVGALRVERVMLGAGAEVGAAEDAVPLVDLRTRGAPVGNYAARVATLSGRRGSPSAEVANSTHSCSNCSLNVEIHHVSSLGDSNSDSGKSPRFDEAARTDTSLISTRCT